MGTIRGGYYIKARQIRHSPVNNYPPHVREIWDYLIREANHKAQEYNGFTVKRGQLFRSYPQIRNDLDWYVGFRRVMYKEHLVKTAMKILKKARMIKTRKKPRGVLITISNYDFYQNPSNYEGYHARTHEVPDESPAQGPAHCPSINKNEKNGNKEKKKERKKKEIHSAAADEVRLSILLFENIRKLDPDFSQPDFQEWSRHIGKMISIDGYTADEIESVINFCIEDDFWDCIILSTDILRKHYKKIRIKMIQENKTRHMDTSDRWKSLTPEDIWEMTHRGG